MPIFDLFSTRQKRSRGEVPDVYQYAELPKPFRVQFVHILRDVFGTLDFQGTALAMGRIHDALCREYGAFRLADPGSLAGEALIHFFLDTTKVEQALDVIELTLTEATAFHEQGLGLFAEASITAHHAIEEVNARFRQHGIGYQYQSGEIVRVDSEFLHQEAVKPSLHLLSHNAIRRSRCGIPPRPRALSTRTVCRSDKRMPQIVRERPEGDLLAEEMGVQANRHGEDPARHRHCERFDTRILGGRTRRASIGFGRGRPDDAESVLWSRSGCRS